MKLLTRMVYSPGSSSTLWPDTRRRQEGALEVVVRGGHDTAVVVDDVRRGSKSSALTVSAEISTTRCLIDSEGPLVDLLAVAGHVFGAGGVAAGLGAGPAEGVPAGVVVDELVVTVDGGLKVAAPDERLAIPTEDPGSSPPSAWLSTRVLSSAAIPTAGVGHKDGVSVGAHLAHRSTSRSLSTPGPCPRCRCPSEAAGSPRRSSRPLNCPRPARPRSRTRSRSPHTRRCTAYP